MDPGIAGDGRSKGWRGRRRPGAPASVILCGFLASALLLGAAPPLVYPDGPPPGFTGGFGEESCSGCHFGEPMNDSGGTFQLSGIPESYEAGKSYPIVISIARAGMKAGGFQLSARLRDDGSQAGSLAAYPADATHLTVVTDRKVEYLHQTHAGSVASSTDTLSWSVQWTAPAAASAVVFHASGNAADGDGSASGDFVYTAEVVSSPR